MTAAPRCSSAESVGLGGLVGAAEATGATKAAAALGAAAATGGLGGVDSTHAARRSEAAKRKVRVRFTAAFYTTGAVRRSNPRLRELAPARRSLERSDPPRARGKVMAALPYDEAAAENTASLPERNYLLLEIARLRAS